MQYVVFIATHNTKDIAKEEQMKGNDKIIEYLKLS